jgi:hypothetical protein
LIDKAQGQNIDVGLSKFSVGAVNAQHPGFRYLQQADNSVSNLQIIEFEVPEKVL